MGRCALAPHSLVVRRFQVMSKLDLKNKFLPKYWWIKHRLKDIGWNSRGMMVPVTTCIGGFVWLLIDPCPEPVVVLITGLLASIVWKRENNDAWYTNAQGNIFKVNFRCDTDGESKRIKLAKDFINKFDFVFKYKINPSAGDSPLEVTIDLIFSDDEDFIKRACGHGYVTRVWKNGSEIYQGGC